MKIGLNFSSTFKATLDTYMREKVNFKKILNKIIFKPKETFTVSYDVIHYMLPKRMHRKKKKEKERKKRKKKKKERKKKRKQKKKRFVSTFLRGSTRRRYNKTLCRFDKCSCRVLSLTSHSL